MSSSLPLSPSYLLPPYSSFHPPPCTLEPALHLTSPSFISCLYALPFVFFLSPTYFFSLLPFYLYPISPSSSSSWSLILPSRLLSHRSLPYLAPQSTFLFTCNFLPSSPHCIFPLFILFYRLFLLPLFSFSSLTFNSLVFISLLLMTSGDSSLLRDATGEQPWKAIPLRWFGHPWATKGELIRPKLAPPPSPPTPCVGLMSPGDV